MICDFGVSRVVTRSPTVEYGDTVFVQLKSGDGWRDVQSFNTLSDDYAFSNAKEAAARRARFPDATP